MPLAATRAVFSHPGDSHRFGGAAIKATALVNPEATTTKNQGLSFVLICATDTQILQIMPIMQIV